MADGTAISWAEATWNPITGCSVLSPGCKRCYAMRLAGTRMKHHWSRAGLTIDTPSGPVWNGEVRFNEDWLDQPLRWRKPRMIFVCAHADLFHEAVPDEWIRRIFEVMFHACQHIFMVLTKRTGRARAFLRGKAYLRNVWIGASVEDQKHADERIPDLLATPAALHWISAEPLLGPVDASRYLPARMKCSGCGYRTNDRRAATCCKGYCQDPSGNSCNSWPCPSCGRHHYWTGSMASIRWVVAGGESQGSDRPSHPDWFRSLRDQCAAADMPFHFKQWGDHRPNGDWYRDHPVSLPLQVWFGDRWRGADDLTPEEMRIAASLGEDDWAVRVGKRRAGRLLDGREHNAVPAACPS